MSAEPISPNRSNSSIGFTRKSCRRFAKLDDSKSMSHSSFRPRNRGPRRSMTISTPTSFA